MLPCMCFSEELNEAFKYSILKELDEERTEKVCICSSALKFYH